MPGDTTALTTARVAEIRARLAAATPGPWPTGKWDSRPYARDGLPWSTFAIGPQHGCPADPSSEPAKSQYAEAAAKRNADAALIAAAPTDIADLLAEVDRLTARVAELERARDVAGIVGWLRAKVGAAYGSGHVPGTAGWTYREIADAIERGDWREEPAVPAPPPDALPEQVPEVPRG